MLYNIKNLADVAVMAGVQAITILRNLRCFARSLGRAIGSPLLCSRKRYIYACQFLWMGAARPGNYSGEQHQRKNDDNDF